MNLYEASKIIKEHKDYFRTGATMDVGFRVHQLKKLKEAIKENQQEILNALNKDLGKPEFEGLLTEIAFVLKNISDAMKNIKSWAKAKKVKTPLLLFGTKSWVYPEPYGTVLIIGPFNYPFQLVFEPLIGALAAGNCAVLKPSESCPAVCAVITRIISGTFDEKYIRVVSGGKETTSALINSTFDYIFFTGSVNVGKIVMEAAARNLIPVTLELGGKSPCIVDKTANIKIAAERIAWGKFINAGQTCVAPDYVLLHKDIKEAFISQIKTVIENFYEKNPSESPDYCKIINESHFKRLENILEKDASKIIYGGKRNIKDLYIAPTLLDNSQWKDAAMEEEIFGPILPLITFTNIDEVIQMVNSHSNPLALYVFTENKAFFKKINERISFGGGCLNDTLFHINSPFLPFGGVGNSGIGAYHGKYSFDSFSHKKSILKRTFLFSVKIIYPPYKNKTSLLKKISDKL